MKVFKNQTFDEERAFYGSKNILVQDCSFGNGIKSLLLLQIGCHN